MILRPYQLAAVESAVASATAMRRPILVAPTGSGKTVMGVAAAMRIIGKGRALWLAHRKELVEQATKHVEHAGGVAGIIMAGFEPTPLAPFQIASVQSLARREMPPADLVVIDECHHATSESYGDILAHYANVPTIGLTATPFRMDGHGLGDVFGELVVAAYTDDLCDAGYLTRPRVYATETPDLRGVKIVAGDYAKNSLAGRMNTPAMNKAIVGDWVRRCVGMRTVVFAVDIAHSEAIAKAFRCAGIRAEHIDGGTPRAEREAILSRLASGETTVVCNCMVLTEGWDLPALQCVIIARPTASLNLHWQMIGRIMRAVEGKSGAIVLDHAGNHHVHGLVTRRIAYSLEAGHRAGASEPLGMRRCMECGLYFDVGAEACPECGWAPTIEMPTGAAATPQELSEFDDSSYEYRRAVWLQLETERITIGLAPGWSWFRFVERFGDEPVLGYVYDDRGHRHIDLIDVRNAGLSEKRSVYERLLDVARDRGFKDGWVSHRYRDAFGVWPTLFVGDVKRSDVARRWAGKFEARRA